MYVKKTELFGQENSSPDAECRTAGTPAILAAKNMESGRRVAEIVREKTTDSGIDRVERRQQIVRHNAMTDRSVLERLLDEEDRKQTAKANQQAATTSTEKSKETEKATGSSSSAEDDQTGSSQRAPRSALVRPRAMPEETDGTTVPVAAAPDKKVFPKKPSWGPAMGKSVDSATGRSPFSDAGTSGKSAEIDKSSSIRIVKVNRSKTMGAKNMDPELAMVLRMRKEITTRNEDEQESERSGAR